MSKGSIGQIVVYANRSAAAFIGSFCGIFAVGCLAEIAVPNLSFSLSTIVLSIPFWPAVGSVFFGAFALCCLRVCLDRRPTLIASQDGLALRWPSFGALGPVPWSEIEQVDAVPSKRGRLCLRISFFNLSQTLEHHGQPPSKRQGKPQSYYDLGPVMLDQPIDKLAKAINVNFLSRPEPASDETSAGSTPRDGTLPVL